MTRKDYELIAQGLLEARPDREDNPIFREDNLLFDQWSYTVKHLATKLENDNSRFDRDRFVGACLK